MLIAIDHKVSETLFHAGRRVPRPFWKFLEYTGDGLVWLSICFLALAWPSTSPTARHLWANFLAGLLIDLIEVGLLKGIARRPRPQHNQIAKDMNVIVAVDHYSFPSGHSSRVSFVALFVACIVASQYPHHYHQATLITIICWSLIVALSRCVMGRHYLSDVIVGGGLGVVTLAIVTKGSLLNVRGGLLVPETAVEYLYDEIMKRIGGSGYIR